MSTEKLQEVDYIYIGAEGKKVNLSCEIPIMQDMNADECFKDGLLANLYSTVEFLKTELIEKK